MKPILRTALLASILAVAAFGVAKAQDEVTPPPGDQEWAAPAPDDLADAGPMGGPGQAGWGRMGGMRMRGGWGSGGMMMGRDGGLLHGRLAEELDLTDVQRDKLQTIGDGLARKQIQMRADLAIARLDLTKLMRADAPSQSDVDAKVNAITRLQGDMMKAGLTARLDSRKVLTADQRKKLDDMRSQRRRGNSSGNGRDRGSRGDNH